MTKNGLLKKSVKTAEMLGAPLPNPVGLRRLGLRSRIIVLITSKS